ncbi:MAG: hypothetical protein ABIS01_01185 [Ferruginibacter sp.]
MMKTHDYDENGEHEDEVEEQDYLGEIDLKNNDDINIETIHYEKEKLTKNHTLYICSR